MANPRQRSKARSHKSHGPSANAKRRLHHKLRKAPPLKGPEVLQESWDRKKTVFQNYAALGLLPSIPIPASQSSSSRSRSERVKLPHLPPTPTDSAVQGESARPKVGFGRIIRDEQGNVIDIVLDEDEEEEGGMEMDVEQGEQGEEGENDKTVEAKTEVVRQLEALSATSAPVERHTSTSERTWLQNLVDAHGDDTEKMARDRKLNVWQKTEGEIRRAIKKAGGVGKLRL